MVMKMSKLTELTVSQMASGLEKGEFSSMELTKAHLDSISKNDKSTGAYLTVTADEERGKIKKYTEK